MKSSYRLFRAFGIDVRLHFTFLLFLIWIVLSAALDGNGGMLPALYSAFFVCLTFAFVLLHEFGHSLAARHYGVPVQDITLSPIGGMARLAYIPRRPRQEFVITLAGPAVNLLLAAFFFALVLPASMVDVLSGFDFSSSNFFIQLLVINLFLLIFNLIPAFPMDGGRILRSLLAMRMDYLRATQIAARVGQAFCVLFFVYGLFTGQILLCFIAVVIFFSASAELFSVRVSRAFRQAYGGTAFEPETAPFSSAGPVQSDDLPPRDLQYRYEELIARGEKVVPVYANGKIVAIIRNVSG
ncbi:MAG: site-2 protease family protein [Planctomycetes bacterium]|nr:site-2 protease family protein [Planctomycetota bacterium]